MLLFLALKKYFYSPSNVPPLVALNMREIALLVRIVEFYNPGINSDKFTYVVA
jgi:hypothetical protein